jgi:ferredoxin
VIQKAHPAESAAEATFIWIDNKNCIRCGKCLRVCPTRAISMKKTTQVYCQTESPAKSARPSAPCQTFSESAFSLW